MDTNTAMTVAEGQFYGPESYGAQWLLLGALALLLAAALCGGVFWLFRRRQVINASTIPMAPETLAALRNRYLKAVGQVQHGFHRGELSERAAHQQLSGIVRDYAEKVYGVPATKMTLEELRHRRIRALPEAIEQYYPAEFGVEGNGLASSVNSAAEAARAVIAP